MRRAPGGPGNLLWRSELLRLGTEVFGHQRDPNRIVIEWLRENSKPTDEILINYEDIPLMYYLPNPVRGGIAAFRVEDDSKKPPEFAVLRRSVPFVHWSVFIREMKRYSWTQMPVQAPDIPWGNNPDPTTQNLERIAVPDLVVARRNQAEAP